VDAHRTFHPDDGALSLAMAVIASSETPLMLLAGDLSVIAVSNSFCVTFGLDPASVPGKRVPELGAGEWDIPQLMSLLGATASGADQIPAYELDLRRPSGIRHLVVNAHRLDYDNKEQVRLLLAVADVTEARADAKLKDDLIRDKAVLLREVQHRIANSLQIIASVLMQSARRVQSDETRGHLKDAHSRVLSIAAVQQQLAASTQGEVALRSYLQQLCTSLGASMIRDKELISISVEVDEKSVTDADTSLSLGLIVTELVINALKHAFIDDQKGEIIVRYRSHGPDWTLTVSDSGEGMPTDPTRAKPGLGTSIVEALANQLEAEVRVTNARPGTSVTITNRVARQPEVARSAS
jgi:two-component system, sensor histidine kinase PdtaS